MQDDGINASIKTMQNRTDNAGVCRLSYGTSYNRTDPCSHPN